MKVVSQGITWPRGFQAVGRHIGIKPNPNLDLALIVSDVPALAAATFTTNSVKAASVLWDMELIRRHDKVKAIVINSGNANACTGPDGLLHVKQTAQTCAQAMEISEQEVFVCSTGVIGVPLPIAKIRRGIEEAIGFLSPEVSGGADAAKAIMTTDTKVKQVAVELTVDGVSVRIGGMAKGSGMIHPNMATMLAFVTTDAAISQEAMDTLFHQSVEKTYNMISVDGDMSTNDTALLLANGTAGNPVIVPGTPGYESFKEALDYVNTHLATAIVKDGEGATKFLEVSVSGAKTDSDARRLAKAVTTSNLVKTAFFGADANWGRILSAMGQSGSLDWNQVSIRVESKAGAVDLMMRGQPLNFDEETAKMVLLEPEQFVHISVGSGTQNAIAWGCDLSYEYVRINGDYRT